MLGLTLQAREGSRVVSHIEFGNTGTHTKPTRTTTSKQQRRQQATKLRTPHHQCKRTKAVPECVRRVADCFTTFGRRLASIQTLPESDERGKPT